MRFNSRKPVLVIGPSIAYVPLTQGLFAIIDADDMTLAAQHTWYAHRRKQSGFYAVTNVKNPEPKLLRMHALLCVCEDGLMPDHRNRNGLDNRRSNLRSSTNADNAFNKTHRGGQLITGVSLHRQSGRWRSRIHRNGREVGLGYFRTQREACAAYIQARHSIAETIPGLTRPEATNV